MIITYKLRAGCLRINLHKIKSTKLSVRCYGHKPRPRKFNDPKSADEYHQVMQHQLNYKMAEMNAENIKQQHRRNSFIYWCLALLSFFWGLAFWSVPMWRIFCESDQSSITEVFTGNRNHDTSKVSEMKPDYDRPIVVRFSATIDPDLPWSFRPSIDRMIVYPGETALAFFTATNKTDMPIVGVSTYTIEPYVVGPYFNKIQCFCFEEQILYPGESVDMPVFFFIDPELVNDAECAGQAQCRLNYNFHKVKMEDMPALPGFENIQLIKSKSLVRSNYE